MIDPAPADDLAASVALVRNVSPFGSYTCSGTLIDRDLIATAGRCVLVEAGGAYYPVGAEDLKVVFSASDYPSGAVYDVAEVEVLPTDAENRWGIAMLRLQTEVPTSVVAKTPPVHLGDVHSLLADAAYANPVLAGFGCTSENPVCPLLRRKATITKAPVQLQTWYGTKRLSRVYGLSYGQTLADLEPLVHNHDLGGPLFMYDVASARWVLAGVHNAIMRESGIHYLGPTWSYFGNAGQTGVAEDHAPLVRPFLGPDADSDGVPDIYDNCPLSECAAAGLALDTCANADQAAAMGGMGDACAFADPRQLYDRNTNVEVEAAINVVTIPDNFDPVPLLRMESDPHLIERSGGTLHQMAVRATPWMGALSDVDRALGHEGVFAEEIGFRFCDCLGPLGERFGDADCISMQECRPAEAVYADPFTSFEAVTAVEVNSGEPIFDEGGLPQEFEATRAGSTLEVLWEWRMAYLDGEIEGQLIDIGGGNFVPSTHGFFASAVIHNDGHYSSRRDSDSDGRLRADLLLQSVPESSDIPIYIPDPPHIDLVDSCLFDCDFPFHWPGEEYLRTISGVRDLINEPMLVQIDPSTYLPFASAWWGEPYRIDFGLHLQDPTAWTFPDAEAPWMHVAPVETIARVRGMGIDSRAMLVAPAGTGANRAYRVYDDPAGWLVADAGIPWHLGGSAADHVELPAGGKAVYSASRGELLLVGGSNLAESHRLRRYRTTTNTVEVIPAAAGLAPSNLVLGATLDYDRNVLYVLDVNDGAEARLVAHNLGDGTARQMWSAPYEGQYASVHLGLREDRQLVLSVADGSTWTAWSIDARAERARFTGRIDGEGEPVSAPTMGLHSLTIAVLFDEGIRYERLPVARFMEGDACSGL